MYVYSFINTTDICTCSNNDYSKKLITLCFGQGSSPCDCSRDTCKVC